MDTNVMRLTVRGILLGGVTGLFLRFLFVGLIASAPLETFSAGYFAFHLPFTTLAHACGGYVAGHFGAGKERRTALLAALLIPSAGILAFMFFPFMKHEVLDNSGGGANYLTYFLGGIFEVGSG